MNQKYLFILTALIIALSIFTPSVSDTVNANAKPTYTISPNSNTYNGNLKNYSTYNNYTKHYYLLRSYLEQLEKTGGGTLVLNKGTYTITNTLYVPSNVTIKLQNGVKIVKGTKTGTTFGPSKSIFQLIRPSLSSEKAIYGAHNGEKNIKFIGYGTAIIDHNFDKNTLGIVLGHNQNVTIENIRFQNMHAGHFLEVDATKNTVIKNNEFINSITTSGNKEAINIDTPDKSTQGFNQAWTKHDKTPNVNLLIENNTFDKLDRAIGTHKYSGGKFHDKVIVRNNKISNMRADAIRVMNWSNSIIEDNIIRNVEPGPSNNRRGILASGAINPTFQNNIFVNMPRAMQFMAWKNSGGGSEYDITYDELSAANKRALETNIIVNHVEDFIRYNHTYNEFGRDYTDFIYIQTEQFSDLLSGDSGYEETLDLVDQEIINGYQADFTFRPHNKISRQHVAALLARALNLDTPTNVSKVLSIYKDVDVDHTYAKEIAAVTEADIFKGSSNVFNPSDNITRAQTASVLVRAFELEENDTDVNLIDLNKIGDSHRDNVEILAQNNITIGKLNSNGQRYFDGADNLNRVQFALFLYRSLETGNN